MTYLVNAKVGAARVDVAVVGEESGKRDAGGAGNLGAVVAALDDVDVGAVLAGAAEAEVLRHQHQWLRGKAHDARAPRQWRGCCSSRRYQD